MGALGWGEALDGIAEGGAGHLGSEAVEEGEEGRFMAFAHFAKHPSGGFVHELMGVGKELLCEGNRGREVVVSDESEGRHD